MTHPPVAGALPRPGWATDVVLLSVGMMTPLAMSSLNPVLPLIQQHYAGIGGAALLTKAIVIAVGPAMVLASLLASGLAALVGRVRLLLLSLLVFAAVGSAGYLLDDVRAIIASRFVVGMVAALAHTVSVTLIGDLHDGPAREGRIGINLAVISVAAAVLIPLCGWVGDIDWRLVFFVHLVLLPFALLILVDPTLSGFDRHERLAAAAPIASAPAAAIATPWRLIAIGLCAGTLAYGMPVFIPFHLRDVGLHGAALAGMVFSVIVGGSVLTSLVFGGLRRRLSARTLFTLGFGVYALGLLLLGTGVALAQILSGAACCGLAAGVLLPTLYSQASIEDRGRVRRIGFVKASFYSGLFVGPTLLQLSWGDDASAALMSLAALAAVLALHFLVMERSLPGAAITRGDRG